MHFQQLQQLLYSKSDHARLLLSTYKGIFPSVPVFPLYKDNQIGRVTNTPILFLLFSLPCFTLSASAFLLVQSPIPAHSDFPLQLFCNNPKYPKQINTSALSVEVGLLWGPKSLTKWQSSFQHYFHWINVQCWWIVKDKPSRDQDQKPTCSSDDLVHTGNSTGFFLICCSGFMLYWWLLGVQASTIPRERGNCFLAQIPFSQVNVLLMRIWSILPLLLKLFSFSMKISVRPGNKTIFLVVVTSADTVQQELNPRLLPSKWMPKPLRCYRDKSVGAGKKGNCECMPNPDTVRSRWTFSPE